MSATKLVIFGVVTILFVVVSVLRPSRHGIWRLLAWELSLVLVLLNADDWFRDALSPLQVCSWVLLLASVCLAVEGIRLLRKIGKPRDELEATTVLVEVGAYRYIRHPLYASFLPFAWGTFLKAPSLLAACVALALCGFVIATAKVEEKLNLQKFGGTYAAYMKRTKMFIPFVL